MPPRVGTCDAAGSTAPVGNGSTLQALPDQCQAPYVRPGTVATRTSGGRNHPAIHGMGGCRKQGGVTIEPVTRQQVSAVGWRWCAGGQSPGVAALAKELALRTTEESVTPRKLDITAVWGSTRDAKGESPPCVFLLACRPPLQLENWRGAAHTRYLF